MLEGKVYEHRKIDKKNIKMRPCLGMICRGKKKFRSFGIHHRICNMCLAYIDAYKS